MLEDLRFMQIPDEKMVFEHQESEYNPFILTEFFVKDDLYPDSDKIRAVGYPVSFPRSWDLEWERISEFIENTNALHFVAAGNYGEVRMWSPLENDYLYWGGFEDGPELFRNALRVLNSGKVFIARTGIRYADGTVVADPNTVNCNDAKDACFTVVKKRGSYSSGASVEMAGLAYYLFHLFDTAQEVAETLKVCSDDVGEPGTDRVFGLGVPNMDCDRIKNAEIQAASAKIVMQPASSHLLDRMLSNKSLSFFYSTSRMTKTGHIGKSMSLGRKTDMILLGGRERTPLGIKTESQESSFFEVGMKRRVKRNISALFTYGQLWDKEMSATVARVGYRYTKTNSWYNLSMYTGYYHLFGKYGFPSSKLINRERVSFSLGSTEVRLSFSFRLRVSHVRRWQ